MQRSFFWVEGCDAKLTLSGLVSEWLFSSGFWKNINAIQGTIFDQYEEDEADVSTLEVVINALEKHILGLRALRAQTVEFVSGWTQDRVAIRACVSKDLALSELIDLRRFLIKAVANKSKVIFSL
ncbi:hypothetical protein [Achromobacter sp.]|uniref:hypothetical protein n=1 Tax=Achromobacter sp. TaxID=134375 RepID=UPI0028AF63B8|nr:hypothetical protein [Achromobacter sp.]